MTWIHTADLPDAFFCELRAMCLRLEAKPVDILRVLYSESGVHASARNSSGDASGLNQCMPATLEGMGYKDGPAAFRALSACEQLPWVEKYFTPHKGKLVNAGACYLANFLPAYVSHASEPGYLLCGAAGPHRAAYLANKGAFDVDHRGFIDVDDLRHHLDRVCAGARWNELVLRLAAATEDAQDPDGVTIDVG